MRFSKKRCTSIYFQKVWNSVKTTFFSEVRRGQKKFSEIVQIQILSWARLEISKWIREYSLLIYNVFRTGFRQFAQEVEGFKNFSEGRLFFSFRPFSLVTDAASLLPLFFDILYILYNFIFGNCFYWQLYYRAEKYVIVLHCLKKHVRQILFAPFSNSPLLIIFCASLNTPSIYLLL